MKTMFLILFAILFLGEVSAQAHADDFQLRWDPRILEVKAKRGELAEATVRLESTRDIQNVQLTFSGSLKSIAQVQPALIASLKAGKSQAVTIVISVPNTEHEFLRGLLIAHFEHVKAKASTNGDPADKEHRTHSGLPIIVVASKPPTLDFSAATLFSNYGDPQILAFDQQAGDSVTYFGTRDTAGLPQSITSEATTYAKGGSAEISVDDSGRPLTATLSDGSQLSFSWTSTSTAVVTAVTADGAYQTIIDIDTATPTTTASEIAAQVPDPVADKIFKSLSNGKMPPRSLPLATIPTTAPALASPNVKRTATSVGLVDITNAVLNVSVMANGQPVSGANVTAYVLPNGNASTSGIHLHPAEQSPGFYASLFPNFNSALSLQSALASCPAFVKPIFKACSKDTISVYTYMATQGCLQLGAALALVTEGAGAEIVAPCEAAFASYASDCAVLQSAPSGAAEGFCANISAIVNEFDPGGVSITATASKDGVSASGVTQVPEMVSTASITINLPLQLCSINSFTTDPVSPEAYETYVATASTTCGAPTDMISMSDHGTDGYVQDMQCTAVADCSMTIPGGAEGVIDTLVVTTSSGATRTTSLVFQ